jgi:PLP dependent protein
MQIFKRTKFACLRTNFLKSTMAEFSSAVKSDGNITLESESRSASIVANAQEVRRRIDEHCVSINRPIESVNLIPVSKLKPAEDIQALYDVGFRHFGENYFQELCEKAAILPKDIQWHFIGHLQSSKSARLIREVPNLNVIETVDTMKLASKLDNGCSIVNRNSLDIFIQVDTSSEDSKSGVPPSELSSLITEIQNNCPKLVIKGLMTIGAPGDMACFDRLVDCANEVQDLIKSNGDGDAVKLELSMGMSGDYVEAITRGSTSVRVGSTIFGARPAKDLE